ncbi:MAG: B12-binding domain-containing radical SAM protein [Candidatus Omnitrophica bacterium]|nr:B12-binding domain-containing radical SAM protein [Candidatus Omnitrophota bacterium]
MLIINPANAEYGGTLSRFTPLSLPMSIGCLAAFLTAHGHKAKIVDEEVGKLDWNSIEEEVRDLPKPYLFGITVLTAQVERVFELSAMLKAKYPDCTVIAGGYHATAMPEEMLTSESIDFVVRGEGERTLLTLVEGLRSGKTDFSDVMGLSMRSEGKIVHTPEAPLIKDLDTLPSFPYDLFVNMLKKTRSRSSYDWGFIVTSRGCPYKCSYCSQRMMTGSTYRFKSPPAIVAELDVLINRFGAKDIFFLDDNFCYKKSRVKEVCDAIIASGLHKKGRFSLQTRADNFYEEVVPMMKAAGFNSVGFGLEAGVERLAKLIHKGETLQQHAEAVRLAQKYGMDVALFMIFGFPTETHAERVESVRFANSLKPTFIKYNNLMPYPGTPLYEDVKDTPRFHKVGFWVNFTSALSEMGLPLTNRKPLPYVPETSSELELTRDVIRYNLLSVFRPKVLWGVITRKHGPGWFKLKARWYFYPSEWGHILRLASILVGNFIVSFTPLFLFEWWVNAMNPRLQRRVSVARRSVYVPSGWSAASQRKAMA